RRAASAGAGQRAHAQSSERTRRAASARAEQRAHAQSSERGRGATGARAEQRAHAQGAERRRGATGASEGRRARGAQARNNVRRDAALPRRVGEGLPHSCEFQGSVRNFVYGLRWATWVVEKVSAFLEIPAAERPSPQPSPTGRGRFSSPVACARSSSLAALRL